MIKLTVLKFLTNRCVAPTVLRWAMRLHNMLYDLCGLLAISVNNGAHPKHRQLRYPEWFCERIEPEWVVIDVGCNKGSMAALMSAKAQFVYGIEIIPRLFEEAQETYSACNLQFLLGDATVFDYGSCQQIDCVTLSNVLEHIDERVQFINRLRTCLPWRNPQQCWFLIRVPTIERDWLAVYKKELGVEHRLDRTHEIEHTREELFKELADAGLTIKSFDVRFGEFYVVCCTNAI
jgi:2-polyprenyl-3-methyl-5-hydroxy-6-metoxy-1,4-benzoquinol methylase